MSSYNFPYSIFKLFKSVSLIISLLKHTFWYMFPFDSEGERPNKSISRRQHYLWIIWIPSLRIWTCCWRTFDEWLCHKGMLIFVTVSTNLFNGFMHFKQIRTEVNEKQIPYMWLNGWDVRLPELGFIGCRLRCFYLSWFYILCFKEITEWRFPWKDKKCYLISLWYCQDFSDFISFNNVPFGI